MKQRAEQKFINNDVVIGQSIAFKIENDGNNNDDNLETIYPLSNSTSNSLQKAQYPNGNSQTNTHNAPTLLSILNRSKNNEQNNTDKNIVDKNTNDKNTNDKKLMLFGVNIGKFDNFIIFLILLFVAMLGFLSTGVVEENFKYAFPGFNFGWCMTCIELLLFSLIAIFERISHFGFFNIWIHYKKSLKMNCDDNNTNNILNINGNGLFQLLWNIVFERKVDLKYHFLVAMSMTFSRAFTNISLLLLNYPTQVVFKSMKLLSVMIGSRVVLKKQYSTFEYVAAPFMVISAILFTLGDSITTLHFNVLGIVIVCISLVFDSMHANSQEYTLRMHNDTTLELLVYSNLLSSILAGFVGVISGEIIPLIKYFEVHNVYHALGWSFIRAACLYIGVAAFVVFTKKFGAVAAVTVTTVRKILTVLLSYLLCPTMKGFTAQHSAGTVLFILSLLLSAFGAKNK